jgi:hypothetical protein
VVNPETLTMVKPGLTTWFIKFTCSFKKFVAD